MERKGVLSFLLFIVFGISLISLAQVPKPKEVIGFTIGEDRKLPEWNQVVEYFNLLDKASDRVKVMELGKTTEGNPFILAIISSPKTIANLDYYRRIQEKLADPRTIGKKEAEKLIREGKTIVLITCTIHSTEIASTQLAMKLAYRLASENSPEVRHILDNVILLLVPSLNPDGQVLVVNWYKKTLGTPYEGTSPPFLYHKYVGHDNNRDWYFFSQKETRLTVGKIHNVWHPQIVYDMHQMGSSGARMFLPPFIDPIDPNVDPILVAEINDLGTSMAAALIGKGKKGVLINDIFDAWTPARSYQHYHAGVRILSELASVRIATPIVVPKERLKRGRGGRNYLQSSWKFPLPWEGGEWHIRDIIEYEEIAAFACLNHAANFRIRWLRNFYLIGKRAVTRKAPPYAYIIPRGQKDPATTAKLLNVLRMGMVEVEKAISPFLADGIRYPAGSYVIKLAQPYGSFAKTLLEVQHYPYIPQYPGGPPKRPYDVTAQTLPFLMGVRTVEVKKPFTADLVLVDKIKPPKGRIVGRGGRYFAFSPETNVSFIVMNRLLKKGVTIYRTKGKLVIGKESLPPGSIIVKNEKKVAGDIARMSEKFPITFYRLRRLPKVPLMREVSPRVGIYKSYVPSISEGWTRFVLEQFEFPYKSIFNRDIRRGGLASRFDAIILPNQRAETIIKGLPKGKYPPKYTGGIGNEGIKALSSFVEEGGVLIAMGSATELPIKYFPLPVRNTLAGLSSKEFFIPGSILRLEVDNTHPIGYGSPRRTYCMFRFSQAFSGDKGETVARYPAKDILASGFILGEGHLAERSALMVVPYGRGKVVLIGFDVLYRAQAYATFRLLFNSIYLSTLK